MRTRSIALALGSSLGLVAALAVAACSDDDDSSTPVTTVGPAVTQGGGTGATTATTVAGGATTAPQEWSLGTVGEYTAVLRFVPDVYCVVLTAADGSEPFEEFCNDGNAASPIGQDLSMPGVDVHPFLTVSPAGTTAVEFYVEYGVPYASPPLVAAGPAGAMYAITLIPADVYVPGGAVSWTVRAADGSEAAAGSLFKS